MAGVTLTGENLSRLRKGRVLQHKGVVESLDFTADGRFVLTAGSYEAPGTTQRATRLAIWDVLHGKNVLNKLLPDGCVSSTAQFLPLRNFDIVAIAADRRGLIRIPVEVDDYEYENIRPMTDVQLFQRTRNKKVLTEWTESCFCPADTSKFRTSSLHSLAVSPQGNLLCSSGHETDMDSEPLGTIKVWDARLDLTGGFVIGQIPTPLKYGVPSMAFDSTGNVFACVDGSRNGQYLRLYDVHKMTSGPFEQFLINRGHHLSPFQTLFSPNGRWLACATLADGTEYTVRCPVVSVYNAYTGEIVKEVPVPQSIEAAGDLCEIGFTADSKFLYAGSTDCSIYFWNVDDPVAEQRPVAVLQGHATSVRAAKWNPRYAFFASACQNLVFWIPDETDRPKIEEKSSVPRFNP